MKNNNFQVSVVIPNFNGRGIMEKNLPKLVTAWNNPKNSIKEVIIVDDASWDESAAFLKKNYSQITLIVHKKNRGFSATVNTGARASSGEFLLLLNTDVIPEENFLEKVFPDFKDPKVFAVSLHEKGFSWAKGFFKDGYIQIEPGEETDKVHSSFWVSGGSGVFRKSMWNKLGGMDEKLLSPFYWEDIDLCYRAAKRGWKNLWEPQGIVVHQYESTISKLSKSYVQRVRERNQLLFHWKNLHSPILIKKHILAVLTRSVKHPGYLRVLFMALARLPLALRQRKKELKESKVSDEAIFAQFS